MVPGVLTAKVVCGTRALHYPYVHKPRFKGLLAPPPPPRALWDTHACARPVPSGTEQKCKAKVKETSSSVACHRRLSLQKRGKDKYDAVQMHLSPMNYILMGSRIIRHRSPHSVYSIPPLSLSCLHSPPMCNTFHTCNTFGWIMPRGPWADPANWDQITFQLHTSESIIELRCVIQSQGTDSGTTGPCQSPDGGLRPHRSTPSTMGVKNRGMIKFCNMHRCSAMKCECHSHT